MILESPRKFVQAPAGEVHFFWPGACVQHRKMKPEFLRMRRLDASLGTRLEKLLNPAVLETLDHMLSVTHRDT